MRYLNKMLLGLLLLPVALFAQSHDTNRETMRKIDWQKEFAEKDFSGLWLNEDNTIVVGFCGENYERARVKFISVTKGKEADNLYYVYGKTKVGEKAHVFRGSMVINDIEAYKQMEYGVDDEHRDDGMKGQYRIDGDYVFYEDSTLSQTGKLFGKFTTRFYVDRNSGIKYMNNYCIDAGWYEGVKGFITFLIKDYDWDNPVIKIVSDKISDVYWSMGVCMEYYERIK